MSDNTSGASADAGRPYYDKTIAELKAAELKRDTLIRQLQEQEDHIQKNETKYLESTPMGNIITGFDNFTKTGGGASSRKKGVVSDQHRIFSKSSTTWNGNYDQDSPVASGQNTPVVTAAPTPASGAPTPPAGGSNSRSGSMGKAGGKKNKTPVEESDTDGGRDTKKARTGLASRK